MAFVLTQSSHDVYFSYWLHGSIAVSSLDIKEAKVYENKSDYKKDLAKMNRGKYIKYHPIKKP